MAVAWKLRVENFGIARAAKAERRTAADIIFPYVSTGGPGTLLFRHRHSQVTGGKAVRWCGMRIRSGVGWIGLTLCVEAIEQREGEAVASKAGV